MKLSELIKNYRNSNNLTMQEFADKSGLSKGYISQLENEYSFSKNKTKIIPSIAKMNQLAKAMELSLDELLRSIDDMEVSLSDEPIEEDRTARNNVGGMLKVLQHKIIPILGDICAGDGIWCEENYKGHIVVDTRLRTDFALMVKGDSMTGANINDGDIALFQKCPSVENGQIAAILLKEDNTVTLKKVYYKENFALLQPANDRYEPIITSEFEVLGWFVGIFFKEMV